MLMGAPQVSNNFSTILSNEMYLLPCENRTLPNESQSVRLRSVKKKAFDSYVKHISTVKYCIEGRSCRESKKNTVTIEDDIIISAWPVSSPYCEFAPLHR